jgi:hypothetical protein
MRGLQSWAICVRRPRDHIVRLSRRFGDLSPGGNADSYLPWLALSYSGVVLLSVELMCASRWRPGQPERGVQGPRPGATCGSYR